MLYLETTGYNYSRRRCEDIVVWFIAKYLPRHNLDIKINHRGLLREGVLGWCSVIDSDSRPRDFEIELHNRMDVIPYTQTLLHELWHVYQHVKGNLKDKRGKRLWKGIDHTETDYSDQPWEIEAQQMELKLFEEYLTTLKKRV
mgnify:FL=1|tara:strand:- start:511 stop:939 length:429 start_codon:yes stop_codon:yes gene_type:complete